MEVVPLELGQPELVGDPALGDLLGEAVEQGVVAPPGHLGAGVTWKEGMQHLVDILTLISKIQGDLSH